MKCPFCNTELELSKDGKLLGCPKCREVATPKVWDKFESTMKTLSWVVETYKLGLELEADICGFCELTLEKVKE